MIITSETIWRVRSAYFTSVVSIMLVLIMIGITSLLIINAHHLSEKAKSNIGFTVFLKDDARPIEIDRLEKMLNIAEYSKSAKYISKSEASAELINDLGEDFIEFLGYNPLPNSIEVLLKSEYADEDSINVIRREIISNKQVKEFFYQKSLIHVINENVRKLSLIGILFTVIFLIISVALINNTVRLSVYSKRFLIKTAQLVGATDKFIRMPFIIKSIISGILSASIASLIVTIVILFLQTDFKDVISVSGIWLIVLIIFIFGVAITAISGNMAVSRFLKIDTDEIYFEE